MAAGYLRYPHIHGDLLTFTAGEISPEHVAVLARLLDEVPATRVRRTSPPPRRP